MSKNEKKFVTVYGNLGQHPVAHQTRERPEEAHRFNPVTEGVDTFEITRPSKTFRTFQIAVNNPKDPETPTWVSCIDWTGETSLFRQGDRVRIYGYFQLRTYTNRAGKEQRVNQLVVKSAGLERAKIRPATREVQEEVEYLPVQQLPNQDQEENEIPF